VDFIYVLYLPDQQLPQIKPTFPPIFLAITRCAAIKRSLLPAVNLNSSVIDVLPRHVPVMGTVASSTSLVRHVFTTSYPVILKANKTVTVDPVGLIASQQFFFFVTIVQLISSRRSRGNYSAICAVLKNFNTFRVFAKQTT